MGEISVRAHGLAIYDRRLAPVTAALHLGLRIPARDFRPVPHDPRVVGWAAEIRGLHLADVARADVSRGVLRAGSRARLERRVALQMIGALLDALGAKNDEAALAAMVDLLEGDAIALASKLWEPINASSTAVALAARKLIATQVFTLKPAELADAWRRRVAAEIAGQVDEDRLDGLKARAAAGLDALREVNAELAAMAAEIEAIGPPDLPEADMGALEHAQGERRDSVLIDSDMDFTEATERLQAHSERAARRTKQARR